MKLDHEIDRTLDLLRFKMQERGFTQLTVQDRLGWGRSYISQLFTKQKGLRVDQVLRILDVIGVEPAEFYVELYLWPRDFARNLLPQLQALGELDDEATADLGTDLRGQLLELTRFLLGNGILTPGDLFPSGTQSVSES